MSEVRKYTSTQQFSHDYGQTASIPFSSSHSLSLHLSLTLPFLLLSSSSLSIPLSLPLPFLLPPSLPPSPSPSPSPSLPPSLSPSIFPPFSSPSLISRINSDYHGALMTLATILTDTGRAEEGLHYMQRAASVVPHDALVRNNMAVLFIQQGVCYVSLY